MSRAFACLLALACLLVVHVAAAPQWTQQSSGVAVRFRGVSAVSDSVDGQFVIVRTNDGGRTWTRVLSDSLPPALPNEGAFAASGTNVAVYGTDHVWVGTGAASAPETVLR
jgi:photosystem II stability/assembly factor-like uncharacterized protein